MGGGSEGGQQKKIDRLLNRKEHQINYFLFFFPKGTTCWVYDMKFPLVPSKWF